MSDCLVPIGIAFLGVVGLTVYVLTVAVRDMTRRMADMNEKLMVILGTRDGGPEVGRALIASNRKPKVEIPGVAGEEKKEEPKGLRMTVGAR